MDFMVATGELRRVRFAQQPPPQPEEGQALLEVCSFGLTSNNITYAKFGEAMSYWSFFPAEDGWGRVPVWGFAEVRESRVAQLPPGVRVYGYLPPSSELLVTPARIDERGFQDASPHRASLPATYNAYARTDSDPMYEQAREDEQVLLRPLFLTAFLIDDLLGDAAFYGADAVVISSASSKTAGALAFLLARRAGAEVVGLSSARACEFSRGLGVYGHVVDYAQPEQLPAGRAVYVDIAGDAAVRDAVHAHFADQLAHSAVVGATHHDRMGEVPDALPGPRPTFFFAPERLSKRLADWGREGLERRVAEAWREYVRWVDGWLTIVHGSGPEQLERAYLELLEGRADPSCAHVLALPR